MLGNDTARVTDFTLDDLTVENLQQLLGDINAFPRQVGFISVPRQTMVKMVELVIQHRKPKILL